MMHLEFFQEVYSRQIVRGLSLKPSMSLKYEQNVKGYYGSTWMSTGGLAISKL